MAETAGTASGDIPDYIIVGAGSAGCVLAERLTASGRHRVVLLEAGGTDRRFFVQMPLGYGKLFLDPSVNWMYRAEPDPGLAGQRDHIPRGRLLGGSSSINAMVWMRGHPQDYEDWKAAGNPGWGWDEALAAYRAIEDSAEGADEWHGAGGPLRIGASRHGRHWLIGECIAACAEAGLPENPDFNGARQEGAGLYQMTIRGRRRNSAARAFLRPAMGRRNLRVITRAQVTRILLEGRRAVGVEYLRAGMRCSLRCHGEVVLAAGAINSPQLLQLSGIGPGGLLSRHGIGVLVGNDNVGAHYSDHHGLNYTWRMRASTWNQILRPLWGKALTGLWWLVLGGGPLAGSINHGGGFFRTRPGQDRPNMQLYMQAFSTLLPRPGERPVLTPDPFPGLSLGLSNCRPTSRGRVRIASPDPLVAPAITANAYGTDEDVGEMLLGVKFLRRIAAQPSFARWAEEELRPGPQLRMDEELIADFRARSGTVYHSSCTCRMGPDPAASVIDADLRVHGVEGLRVADASSFPNLIAGNTNASAILVGWLGAGRILRAAR